MPASPIARSTTATSTPRSRGADLVVSERFRFPRWSCTPVECYGVVCDWNDAEGSLTAWANFQGPFTLHSVAAAALGLPGSKLRLITPPDSGGSFGIKSAVFAYVVLMGLASRKLGVPVRWIEDRLEHLAASSAASGRVTEVEAGFTADGELVALRYDAIEDVGAYVRAPEPATLYRMHGSLSGAYRVQERRRAQPRRPHEHPAERAQPWLRRPAALPRARADDDDRCRTGSDSTRPSFARRNLIRGGRVPVPDAVRRALRLRRLRGLPRRRARARALRRAPRGERAAARADGRLVGVGIACVVEPSISNMGYITLAEPAATRGPPEVGERRGLHDLDLRARRASPSAPLDDAAGPGPPDRDRADRRRPPRRRAGRRRRAHRHRHSTSPWTVASGNYSSRFSGVGAGAVAARSRAARGQDRRDPRAPRTTRPRRSAGSRERRIGTRSRSRPGWSRASR